MNERTREGFYVLWTIAILLCLVMCVVVLIYVSVKKPPETAALQMPGAVQADGTQQDGTAPASELPRTVFLGDSTTNGLAEYNILPRTQVWTPASGTLTLSNYAVELIQYDDGSGNIQSLSIADCAAARQPTYLIITLGLNGISFMDEATFKQYYTELITAIQAASPGTTIICNTIFPVIDSMVTSDVGNSRINAANDWIGQVASQTGTHFLNTHDALTDESGNLDPNLDADDGIHLNADGLNAFLQLVQANGYW